MNMASPKTNEWVARYTITYLLFFDDIKNPLSCKKGRHVVTSVADIVRVY